MEDGDGSSRLDYSSTLALSADIGEILRVSANPVTPADLKLPLKGTTGSLGWSSEVLVDTAALFAVDVRIVVLVAMPSTYFAVRDWVSA